MQLTKPKNKTLKDIPNNIIIKNILPHLDLIDARNLKCCNKEYSKKFSFLVFIKTLRNNQLHLNKVINAVWLNVGTNYLKNFQYLAHVKYLRIIDNKVIIDNLPPLVDKLVLDKTCAKIKFPLIREISFVYIGQCFVRRAIIVPSVKSFVVPHAGHFIMTYNFPTKIIFNYSRYRRIVSLREFQVLKPFVVHRNYKIYNIIFTKNNTCGVVIIYKNQNVRFDNIDPETPLKQKQRHCCNLVAVSPN